MSDFEVLYPGIYIGKEKAPVEKYINDNKAIVDRGEIDIQALIYGKLPEDTPGIGPSLDVTEAMVRYFNQVYDPDNPVLNDAAYAKQLGYQDILAYPTFGCHDDSFMIPYPPAARDSWFPADLNHNITRYKPVYPGDTLYFVLYENSFNDLTPPEGAINRWVTRRSVGRIYNQRGEKVYDLIFRSTRSLKIFKDERRPKDPDFTFIRESPDWKIRPAHYYTDDDWEFIKDLWLKERRRGATPMYWEDVHIGDEPAWTVEGPILQPMGAGTPRFAAPFGINTMGSCTLKKQIMDPEVFKTLIRGEEDGIYRLPDSNDYTPPVPDNVPIASRLFGPGGPMGLPDMGNQTDTRNTVINFLGRDIAIRHINNWMGDYGWLDNIRWSIMSPQTHAAYGKTIPQNPEAVRFLDKIPKMRRKHVIAHGLTGDLAIVKSQVYDKYVRDGEFLVELGWWFETIEGYIWQEGGATVKLPSKGLK